MASCGAQIERTADESGGLDRAAAEGPMAAEPATDIAPAEAATPVAGSPGSPSPAEPGQGRSNQGLSGVTAVSSSGSNAEVVDEPASAPKTLTVPGASLLADPGPCNRVWLDEPKSEIATSDLTVTHTNADGSSEPWPPVEECAEVAAWSLMRDDSGVWLQLCAAACVQVSQASSLTIVSSYVTEPRYQVR